MAVSTHAFQTPKGTRDFYPADMAVRQHIERAWREVSINHGFDQIDGPTFEHLELYTIKSGEGIVSELFSFRRAGGDTDYALRPEFTPTLARMYAARANALPNPTNWFSICPFFRAERPQRGRLREHYQWNIDVIGDERPAADAQIIAVAVNLLERLGLTPGGIRIRINHRGYLEQTLTDFGFPADRMEQSIALVDAMYKLAADEFKNRALESGLDESRWREFSQLLSTSNAASESRPPADLGGFVPARKATFTVDFSAPPDDLYTEFYEGTKNPGGVSTTMAFVRLLTKLIKDKGIGNRIVPIVPDEARTFGMEPLFRQVGIYAAKGQLYEPVDRGQLLYYRESKDGQVLEEGITEAGSMSSFIAAGTSYATHGQPTLPFYIFYSMFGFQRIGDLAWAFADSRGRGFLMGATAGRTTLNGEGLQHEDGHSHVLATTFPNLRAYDPAFAYEIAAIIRDGMRCMVDENQDVFYYITIQNENYSQPPMPDGVEEGVLKGLYRYKAAESQHPLRVQLFGSACILNEALKAQEILAKTFKVSADVWSATSYQLLRNEALRAERWNRLHPGSDPRVPYIAQALDGVEGPFVAATDYMKLVPDQIRQWVPGRFVTLGTDGFGMSDTREALRRHFDVDAEAIVIAALHALSQDGHLKPKDVAAAIKKLDCDPEKLRATSPHPP